MRRKKGKKEKTCTQTLSIFGPIDHAPNQLWHSRAKVGGAGAGTVDLVLVPRAFLSSDRFSSIFRSRAQIDKNQRLQRRQELRLYVCQRQTVNAGTGRYDRISDRKRHQKRTDTQKVKSNKKERGKQKLHLTRRLYFLQIAIHLSIFFMTTSDQSKTDQLQLSPRYLNLSIGCR